jgi:hypothetical protein
MNPTTDELIEESCDCNYGQRCYRCGILKGRLDVLEEFAGGIDKQFIYDVNHEVSKIKAVLHD